MRKCHRQMCAAFAAGKPARAGAHAVHIAGSVTAYRLHSTDIITHDAASNAWHIANGGWDTPTTRAALRAFGFDPADAGSAPTRVDAPAWTQQGGTNG